MMLVDKQTKVNKNSEITKLNCYIKKIPEQSRAYRQE